MSARGTLVLLALAALGAKAQVTPHVGYVYPAGGRQGTTFEVTVGGQFLGGAHHAFITGPGVEATVIEYVKPLNAGQANQLRDKMKELLEKKTRTGDDEKTLADIRKKLATLIRRPVTPAIAETVRIQVTLAPDATPGARELRLLTPSAVTNPLLFSVDQLQEFSKPPAKVEDAIPIVPPARLRAQMRQNPPAPMSVTLPAIVNGQIGPGAVDRIRFQAAKGMRLVVAARARELIPYISDAVPGWFQATLGLYDPQGKEVAYADHYSFHPDPVLYYEVPADGAYTLEVKDSIYRGREDFVYRIAMGELPFVTGIFPLGGKTGRKTTVAIKGWNLPAAKLTQDNKRKAAGIYPITVRKGEWMSNRRPFAVDGLPETMEKEPNNRKENAQRVKLPVIVNGRIDAPGDRDVFRFEGRAGEEIVAEVLARRLESPLDSILKLTDAGGRELASNDDFEDKGAGLLTHQADSRILAKLPANGTYYLYLGDTQHKGGAEYGYRLRISRPQPDFELRVTPSSINARGGATVPITVYALRRDGFGGEIALKLKDAPPGFMLSGAAIPAHQDSVRMTLTVPVSRIEKPRPLGLEGHALIQGKEAHRAAVPAEDMMQAFAYHHLVAAKEWLVRVTDPGRANQTNWKVLGEKLVRLPAGGTAPVKLFLPLGRLADQVQLALNEPPEGIAIQDVSRARDAVSVVLRADGKVKPGMQGNLIVDAFLLNGPNKRRVPLGMLPAIPFEVVR